MADVEIRFDGDDESALSAIAAIDAALESIEKMAASVKLALGDIEIPSGTVSRVVAEAATINRALKGIEEQANDTSRALSLQGMAAMGGPAGTMLSSWMRGIPFVGYPPTAQPRDPRYTGVVSAEQPSRSGRQDWRGYWVMEQGGAPGTALVPYDPANLLLQNRVFAAAGAYAAQVNPNQYPGPIGPVWHRDVGRTLGLGDPASMGPGEAAAIAYLASRAGSRDGGGGGGLGLGALLAAAGMGGGGIGVSRFLNPFGRFGFNIPGARLGSLLGLAGFGAERILGTTLGIGGSMLGGIAGGALYGLGMGGTMAVGMGTDMAGIGQAGGDIRTVTKDLNALDTAIQQYGKNSQQAAQAQAQLNTDLGSFSPVARQAVLNASLASQHFKALFDYFTGPAEKTGAQIIGQGIRTGQAFLPSLGSFASGNMNIIQRGLQPLFSWLQNPSTTGTGGGLGIFNQLEELFQKRLPTAVHAGTQAFELFSHAVLDAAKQTGGFLPKLDEFLTKMNSPQGLARMNEGIVKLIDLFKTWTGLLLSVGKMVYELFAPAVGLGADFARQLTNIVNLFSHWLSLTSTQTMLHNLFEAHRQQMDALFQVMQTLLPVLESVLTAFMKIETVVARATVPALQALAGLINAINRIPFADTLIGWSGALFLIYRAWKAIFELKIVSNIVGWISSFGNFYRAVATNGVRALQLFSGEVVTAEGTTVPAFAAMTVSAGALVAEVALLTAGLVAAYWAYKTLASASGSLPTNQQVTSGISQAWIKQHPGLHGAYERYVYENASIDPKTGKLVPRPGDHVDTFRQWLEKHHPKAFASATSSTTKHKTAPDGKAVDWHQFVGQHAGEDCSLFTQRVYSEVWHISIPRTSEEQFAGGYPASGSNVGDLLFYNGYNSFKPPGHVALYIGNGNVIQDNGSGHVSIMAAVDLDSLGYMGARTYLKQNAIASTGSPGPGVPGASTVPTGVPSLAALQRQQRQAQIGSSRQATLAQGLGALQGIATARGDLGSLPRSWQHRFTPELSNWQQQIEHLDKELRDKSISQKTIDTIRGRIDIITRYIQQATARIQTTVAAFQQLSTGRGLIGNIHLAMTGSLSALGLSSGPLNPMNVDTLGQARATEDPKLKRWEQQLERMDHTLREKTVSQATVNTITQRMQVIQKNVTGALDKIKQAAQTQLQAATSAWSAFTSAFDSTFTNTPGGMSSQQLTAMQNVIGQGQLAVSLDQAQSAILGGQPGSGDQIAQTILNNMQTALGVQTTSTGIPYTQQQLDNWLAIWGNYYASLGYTPQQMFDAFNKLLASVGLPPIDNPFSTGNLPLPPGAGTPGSTSPSSSPTGNAGLSGVDTSIVNALHNAALQHASSRGHRRKLLAVHSTSTHAGSTNVTVHTEVKPQVELRFEKGLEWLDGHVKVIVDGEIQKVGQKANARARSGRHTARGRP